MQARNTLIHIVYEGKDISRDIAPFLLTFSFTDNEGGKADDLALTLEDKNLAWLLDWTPSKSDTITASIIKSDGDQLTTLPCGTFSVDQIDYSCPPSVLTLKAASSAITTKARREKHTRSWENVTLRGVLSDLAAENGLSLFMDSAGHGVLERVEQVEQSDLEFMKALCEDYGQAVKIQAGQVIVYDLEEYEAKTSAAKITREDKRLLSWKFSTKTAKTYKGARVKYHDPVKHEDYEAEDLDDYQEGSEEWLEIHERVESQGDAQRVAHKRLHEANRREVTGSVTLIGDVRFLAGMNVDLEDFGNFSGKYSITKATHKVDSSGYTTTLELSQGKTSKGVAKKRKKSRKTPGSTGTLYYEGERHY